MNQNEFKKELHEYIDKTYDEFTECQAIVMDIFRVFHRIACSHGITYYMAFGSLLGVVRDGDMIPWDYDMDVCVPYNQIHELMRILEKELPEDYFIISNFTDKKFPYFQTRIGNVRHDVNLIHLDIFYLCGAPSENQKEFRKELAEAFVNRSKKMFVKYEREESASSKTYFYWKKLSYGIKLLFTSVSGLDKKLNKYLTMYDLNSAQYWTIVTIHSDTFKKSDFEPCRLCKIRENEYMIPKNPDAILKTIYTDYQAYLPIRSRFYEMYTGINRYWKSMEKLNRESFGVER